MTAKRKFPIVGSLFGLDRPSSSPSPPPFIQPHSQLLVNARSAISLVVATLEPRQVWLPSYLCGAIVEGLAGYRARWRFYEVGIDLKVSSRAWLSEVEPGDLVLLVDYFGFPTDALWARMAKARKAWVLEDACQALLSRRTLAQADYLLYSPRKFVGVADGGVLTARGAAPRPTAVLDPSPPEWWRQAQSAVCLKAKFDRHGGERQWLALAQAAEASAPVGPYAMAESTVAALTGGIDYRAIGRQRRKNYRALLAKLPHLALFPALGRGVVPLGFPVRLGNRDEVRERLFAAEIYPAVHWQLGDHVPRCCQASHRLAREIMTLPCDQRYGAAETERLATMVLAHAQAPA